MEENPDIEEMDAFVNQKAQVVHEISRDGKDKNIDNSNMFDERHAEESDQPIDIPVKNAPKQPIIKTI